jgi:hypothetical protein
VLSNISILRLYEPDKTCFEISDGIKANILCAFVSNDKSLDNIAREWVKDILAFSKDCRGVLLTDPDDDMDPSSALDVYEAHERKEMNDIILNTQKLAIKAIEKEMKMENLIEQQEDLKGKYVEEQMNQKLQKVKEQQELITKALDQKKKEAEIYTNKLSLKSRLKQMTQQFKEQIKNIREDLKLRLQTKSTQGLRTKEDYEGKINEVKAVITKDLLKANKKGNYQECDPDRPVFKIIDYCKKNYPATGKKQDECKTHQKFCNLCCEAEYGDLHLEERTECYSKCDSYYIYHIQFTTHSHTQEMDSFIEDVKKTELLKMIKESLNITNQ